MSSLSLSLTVHDEEVYMILSSLKNLGTLSLTVVAALMLCACASDSSKLPPDLNSLKTGPKGKLPLFEAKENYPDFVALVPAPPAEGSYIFANDKKIFKETRKLKGTQIWKDAAQFAEVKPEVLSAYFSPVMSKPIYPEVAPRASRTTISVHVLLFTSIPAPAPPGRMKRITVIPTPILQPILHMDRHWHWCSQRLILQTRLESSRKELITATSV